MQGIVGQWGCPMGLGCASPKPHLPVGQCSCGGWAWQWRHISRAFGVWGARARGRAEGQLLQRVPGSFSVLQAGGFFPLATQKMVFDLIQLPLFAFSCEVLV